MTTGQYPPPQVPPPQDPYNQSVYPPSYSPPVTPTGYSSYPPEPAKKSGGSAVLVVLMILFALAAIGGWVLYIAKNNALNLANTEIANKTNEIAGLDTNLRSANTNIDTLTRQLTASQEEATRFENQVTSMTKQYKCTGVQKSEFKFTSEDAFAVSLAQYVLAEYGSWNKFDFFYFQRYTNMSIYMFYYDNEVYSYIVYYAEDSKIDQNRVYFINGECFID